MEGHFSIDQSSLRAVGPMEEEEEEEELLRISTYHILYT